MTKLAFFIVTLLSLYTGLGWAKPRIIVHALPNVHDDPVENYYVKLLSKALSYSGDKFQLQPATEFITQSRALREIGQRSGMVDVFWSMTSVEREQFLTPVRFPLSKGLLGWRLLLANSAIPLHLTERNKTNLLLVQGHDWPDAQILKANGFRVHAADDYVSMFNMVEKGRADAMPRSIIEIEQELGNVAKELKIVPNIMLYYPTAQYFFVAHDDHELAQAIEYGLGQMLIDGSFEYLFQQQYGTTLKKLTATQRHVFMLKNPLLPPETPLQNSLLWHPLPAHFIQVN